MSEILIRAGIVRPQGPRETLQLFFQQRTKSAEEQPPPTSTHSASCVRNSESGVPTVPPWDLVRKSVRTETDTV